MSGALLQSCAPNPLFGPTAILQIPEAILNLRKRLHRIVRSAPAHRFFVWLSASYLGFVYRTTSWTSLGFDDYAASLEGGTPFIIVNWHGRLSMVPYAWDWKAWDLTILSFDHPAAQVMVDTVRRLGIHVLALNRKGSNTGVLRQAVRAFRAGHCIGITPDGPFGPNLVMKPGAVELAAICRAQIAPVTFSVDRRFVLKTWDRFVLPLPFGRGVFIMGPALSVPRKLSPETLANEMERLRVAMSNLDAQADAHFGHSPRPPD